MMFFSHSVDRHTLALCKTLFSSDSTLIGKILAHYAIFNNDPDLQASFNRALQKLATGLSKKAEKLELQLDDITNADKLNVLFLRAWLVEDCPSLWLDNEKNMHPTFINLVVHLASGSDFHAKSPLSSRQGFSLYQTLDLNITALGKSLPMVERAIWMRLSQIPGIDFNESNNYWGNTSLHFKISNGQSEDAIRFIRNILTLPSERSRPRLDVNRLSTGFGTSPLHLAVAKGYRNTDSRNVPVLSYVSLVKELCEAGADTNLKTAPVLCQEISQKFFLKPLAIQAEFTALHIACARRDLELIAILLEYSANLTIRNADGLTPIDVLQLPYENRKCIVDSISGPGLNNFETYEQEHSSESHMAACYQLLHDATTSRQSHCSLSNG